MRSERYSRARLLLLYLLCTAPPISPSLYTIYAIADRRSHRGSAINRDNREVMNDYGEIHTASRQMRCEPSSKDHPTPSAAF